MLLLLPFTALIGLVLTPSSKGSVEFGAYQVYDKHIRCMIEQREGVCGLSSDI